MKKIYSVILCPVLFLNLHCSDKIITKEGLKNKNTELSGFTFTAKADIYPHFIENVESEPEKILKKGDTVSLAVETSGNWIRIKAYAEKSKRQQAIGKTVIYLFREELVKGENIDDVLEKHIENMFTRTPVK